VGTTVAGELGDIMDELGEPSSCEGPGDGCGSPSEAGSTGADGASDSSLAEGGPGATDALVWLASRLHVVFSDAHELPEGGSPAQAPATTLERTAERQQTDRGTQLSMKSGHATLR
jgi:hypothetical protein